MANVTYVRVTPTGGTADQGETGTWIPVSDLNLETTADPNGSTLGFSPSFALANDDAVIGTLDTQALIGRAPLKVEFATFDNSTAANGSAGTPLSYSVASNAFLTDKQQAGPNIAGYTLAVGSISQTTYPPGGAPSSSAYAIGTGPVTPTPAPRMSRPARSAPRRRHRA